MDFKKHILRAWELTWQFIVSLVLMTLVMTGVAVITLFTQPLAPTFLLSVYEEKTANSLQSVHRRKKIESAGLRLCLGL
jgi:hypothetical protein